MDVMGETKKIPLQVWCGVSFFKISNKRSVLTLRGVN